MTRLNIPDRCKHHQWQETSRTYMNGLPGFVKVVYMCKSCGKPKQEDKPLDDISRTGGFVDAGPALKAMIDSGFLAVYVPKPGELDKAIESLARSIEEKIWQELIK